MDHRRRAERDRPRRPEDAARPGVPAAGVLGLRQPEHRRLRPPRGALVHRSERDLRAARSEGRQSAGLPGTERRGSVRDHRDAVGRRLLRLARRQLPRPDRRRAVHRPRPEPADARPGCATCVVGLEGADLGERVECRQGCDVCACHRSLARVAAPGLDADAVRGLRGRQGRGLAERLRRERAGALRPQDREVHSHPASELARERQADPGPSRARCGARSPASTSSSSFGLASDAGPGAVRDRAGLGRDVRGCGCRAAGGAEDEPLDVVRLPADRRARDERHVEALRDLVARGGTCVPRASGPGEAARGVHAHPDRARAAGPRARSSARSTR